MNDVFDLNNEGVSLLSSGDGNDIRRSGAAFQRALAILSDRAAMIGNGEDDDNNDDLLAMDEQAARHLPRVSPSSQELLGMSRWEFFLFRQPLLILPSPTTLTRAQQQNHLQAQANDNGNETSCLLALYSAIILFNMSLMFHERNMLRRAVILYGRCFQLLYGFSLLSTITTSRNTTTSSASDPSNGTITTTTLLWTCPTAQTLSLMVLNNLAELFWHFGQVEKAQECMRELSFLLAGAACATSPPSLSCGSSAAKRASSSSEFFATDNSHNNKVILTAFTMTPYMMERVCQNCATVQQCSTTDQASAA